MLEKDMVALHLAKSHHADDPAIVRIVRLLAAEENAPAEPIKLLEVNPGTSPSGIMPMTFNPDPSSNVPFSSVVVEITVQEFSRIQKGKIELPHGWTLGPVLHPAA
jgi:hypothetical protein